MSYDHVYHHSYDTNSAPPQKIESPNRPLEMSRMSDIRDLAKARFLAEEQAKKDAASADAKKEQEKQAVLDAIMLDEKIKARVAEEQVRMLAERALVEAEAKRVLKEKEEAILAVQGEIKSTKDK